MVSENSIDSTRKGIAINDAFPLKASQRDAFFCNINNRIGQTPLQPPNWAEVPKSVDI